MAFDDHFNELDRMLCSESTDYAKMRSELKGIGQLKEFARLMGPAQDRLYAAIARGHRQVVAHLERGDCAAAIHESAKAVAWFYVRFQGSDSSAMAHYPHIAEELRAVRELVGRSQILKDALSKTTGNELHGT